VLAIQGHACLFFRHKWIVLYELFAHGHQQCYSEVLTKLWEFVRRKRPELWPDKWLLHHGIAAAHDALRVRELLAKKSITKNGPSILFTWRMPWTIWPFPTITKCPEGTDICWYFWHPTQRDCELFKKTIFKIVSSSGAIVSRSA
jgi:hypothetical protein